MNKTDVFCPKCGRRHVDELAHHGPHWCAHCGHNWPHQERFGRGALTQDQARAEPTTHEARVRAIADVVREHTHPGMPEVTVHRDGHILTNKHSPAGWEALAKALGVFVDHYAFRDIRVALGRSPCPATTPLEPRAKVGMTIQGKTYSVPVDALWPFEVKLDVTPPAPLPEDARVNVLRRAQKIWRRPAQEGLYLFSVWYDSKLFVHFNIGAEPKWERIKADMDAWDREDHAGAAAAVPITVYEFSARWEANCSHPQTGLHVSKSWPKDTDQGRIDRAGATKRAVGWYQGLCQEVLK
jgi:hypothetical protein